MRPRSVVKIRNMDLLNLPNKITLSRILAVPVIVILLYYESRITCLLAAIGFTLASATDIVDGHIARRSGMITSFGKFLDPLADKVLISSVLIILVQLGWINAWIAIIIICRDLIITGLRAIAVEEGMVIAADAFGKWKTVMQMVALVPIMLHYSWFGFNPDPLGQFLLYIALALTVFSGGNYLYTFYRYWASRQYEKGAAG